MYVKWYWKIMNKRHNITITLIGLLLLVAIGAYVVHRLYTRPVLPPVKPVSAERIVTLYFYDPDTDTLKSEQRMVASSTDIVDTCRTIVSELERGSMTGLSRPIPPDVKVNRASWRNNGVLVIDLSDNLVKETPEGSSAEISAVYAIVDSIAKNIGGVNAVQLTVDGRSLETLETHIEIDQPIAPDYTK